jgi:hypothetical protein
MPRRTPRARWFLLAAVPALPLLVWACSSHPLEVPRPLPEGEIAQYQELNPINQVDIVFVVDNSGSMAQEQANLAMTFPAFAQELERVQGADYHIAVVSNDLSAGASTGNGSCAERPRGDEGVFCQGRTGPGAIRDFCTSCNVDVAQGRFLRYAGGMGQNFQGSLVQAFSCMAQLGTQGCGFEHQTAALRKALTNATNGPFLREQAYLAFVVITDEEDCSGPEDSTLYMSPIAGQTWNLRCSIEGNVCGGQRIDPTMAVDRPLADCAMAPGGPLNSIQETVQAIVNLKNSPNQIISAGIFGWPLPGQEATARYRIGGVGTANGADVLPVCQSANLGSAIVGFRIKAFVESFPNHSIFSICQGDFRQAMQKIGEKIRVATGEPCLGAPLVDVKPGPEFGADCTVVDRVAGDQAGQWNETPIPQCKGGDTGACWNLVADATCSASGYKVIVNRNGTMPALGTQQSIRCLSCVNPMGCPAM